MGNYIAYVIVAREFATVRSLFQLFRRTHEDQAATAIHVRPWYPDRCGGLGRLNKYAISFSYFLAAVAFGLLLFTYESVSIYGVQGSLATDPGLWLGVAAYFILAPSLFFLTLGSEHRAMLSEKAEDLHGIAEELDTEYRNIREVHKENSAVLGETIQRIKQLHELYELTAKFPVWPFDIATLRKFVTALLAPLITVAVPVAVPIIAKILA